MSDINLKNQKQKGISVLYAVFIMSILMAISFGISAILISQIKMLGEIGHSVVAFYAADSGIEEILLNRDSPLNIDETTLANGATYEVFVTPAGGDCLADYYCIKSIGEYQKTKRAIEINY
jgi:hypothetical protein